MIEKKALKISVRTLSEGQFDKAPENGEPRPFAVILGRADSYFVRGMDVGRVIHLRGVFQGVNLATGRELIGRVCILPEQSPDGIITRLKERRGPVEFCVQVNVRRNEYGSDVFETVDIVGARFDDALQRLRSEVNTFILHGIQEAKKHGSQ